MARAETGTAVGQRFGTSTVTAGAAGGLLGGIAFGLLMQNVIEAPVLEMAIPAMYGIEGPALAVGWTIHLVHGVVIGLVYAVLATTDAPYERTRSVVSGIGLGAAYGALVWLALAVIVMPIWLRAVDFGGAPPLPNVSAPSLVGHVVYGALLGVAFAALES